MYQRGFAGIENLERMIDWNLKHKGKKEMDVGSVIPHFFQFSRESPMLLLRYESD